MGPRQPAEPAAAIGAAGIPSVNNTARRDWEEACGHPQCTGAPRPRCRMCDATDGSLSTVPKGLYGSTDSCEAVPNRAVFFNQAAAPIENWISDAPRRRARADFLVYPGAGRSVSRHFSMLSEIILTDDNADWVKCAYRAVSRRRRSPSDCR
jgi:hypothetical protein